MKKIAALTFIALLTLGACAREPAASATAPVADSASTAMPVGPTPAVAAAVPAPAATLAAVTPAATKPAAVKPDAGMSGDESALERAAALPADAKLPAGKWTAGTHYRPVLPAQPTDAAPGKVEVVEMFWYGCPHCYSLDPYLESWSKNKPAYVEFRQVPITWGEVHRSHARMFYALQALGKEAALHTAVFSEMHDKKNFMFTQGNEAESLAAQLAFVKAHGISEADYRNAYNSFSVQTNLQKSDELMRRFKVESVPLIVVNGKYLTDVAMGGSPANVISIIGDLAASEKRR